MCYINFIIYCVLTCGLFIILFHEKLYLLFGVCVMFIIFELVLVLVLTFTLI